MSDRDPYAIVEPNSLEEASLRAVGWTDTDTTEDGWLHMEPTASALRVVFDPNDLEVDRIDATVLEIKEGDAIVACAPELVEEADLNVLENLIREAKADPDFIMVSNFDIRFQLLRFNREE